MLIQARSEEGSLRDRVPQAGLRAAALTFSKRGAPQVGIEEEPKATISILEKLLKTDADLQETNPVKMRRR